MVDQEQEVILGRQDGLQPISGITAGDFRFTCALKMDPGAMFTLMFRAMPNYSDGFGIILQAKKDWSGFYRMDGAWGLRKWLEPVYPDGIPADTWVQVEMEVIGDVLELVIPGVTELVVDISQEEGPRTGYFFYRHVLGGMTLRDVKIGVPEN